MYSNEIPPLKKELEAGVACLVASRGTRKLAEGGGELAEAGGRGSRALR